MFRRSPSSHRFPRAARYAAAAAFALLAACKAKVDRLSYDSDGVAKDVLALIPHNDQWARSLQADAVLYRIELRSEAASDSAPAEALYSYYSAGSKTFMTATSDPKIPWAGAEPQDWPADRQPPLPLPPLTLDFKAVWAKAREGGLTKATSAVLEVNQRTMLPIVAWSIAGEMPDMREGGIYFDAVSFERMYHTRLVDPPTSATQLENAMSAYRGALRGDATDGKGCAGKAIAIPTINPVVCFDLADRSYSAIAPGQ